MYLSLIFSHKEGNSEEREKILPYWKKLFEEDLPCKEKLFLETCYRLEMYFFLDPKDLPFISQKFLTPFSLEKKVRILKEVSDIFEHLVLVATGADSPFLGESEIFHQIKRAYQQHQEKGFLGENLSFLFHKVFHVAKKLREESHIQEGGLSLTRLSYLICKDHLLPSEEILLIGTGEIATSLSRYFFQREIPFTIATRNKKRKEFLESHAPLRAIVYTKETLPLYLEHFPIWVFATDTPYLLKERDFLLIKNPPRLILDLGFPPNVEGSIKRYVKLYQLEDLKEIIGKRLEKKEKFLYYILFRVEEEKKKFLHALRKKEEVEDLIGMVSSYLEKFFQGKVPSSSLMHIRDLLLYPTLKSLRTGKPVEEVISSWKKRFV